VHGHRKQRCTVTNPPKTRLFRFFFSRKVKVSAVAHGGHLLP
jgi:hypothetical protein